MLHLVCEGDSEQQWFRLLVHQLAASSAGSRPRIDISNPGTSDAAGLMREAARRRQQASEEDFWFVVCDSEAHDSARRRKLLEAEALGGETLKLVVSHLCLEVWLLCLIPETPAVAMEDDPAGCVRALKIASTRSGWGVYRKGDAAWLARTLPHLATGLLAAEGLRGHRRRLLDPAGQDEPFTEVPALERMLHELFEVPLPD